MDDTISRQAAIDALIAQANLDGAYGYISAKDVDIILDSLPSAQRTGTWTLYGNTSIASCKCGFMTDRYATYSYCPSCGARMEATDHGND